MRDFSHIKRMVVKIGTNTLTRNGAIDFEYIENMAGQIAALRKRGIDVLLVSSGAIGVGANELKITKKIAQINLRQACAAVGQPILLHRYKLAFHQYGIPIAQVLVTRDIIDQRISYVNLQRAVNKLLELGVMPIFNENDCISIREIQRNFGDNDQLSAHIASKIDVDLLVILSDIDALYDKNPSIYPDAKPIAQVDEITGEVLAGAGEAGSSFSTGGMKTKIKAVAIARKAGCRTIIAHGRADRVLLRIVAGEEIGTLFTAPSRIKNRKRWILNSTPKGKIVVDSGADLALENRKSLLPSGLIAVEGEFAAGDVVMINSKFKAVSGLDSSKIRQIIGCHSSEVKDLIGTIRWSCIARSSDIIRLTE